MSEHLIEVRGLRKEYPPREKDGPPIAVLQGVDLDLDAGDRVSVVGKSGAGKSTLLHVLGALDIPTSGQVLFDGVDIFAMKERDLAAFRNRSVGFIFQFHHLLPDFTALENVAMPGIIHRELSEAEANKRATDLLEAVGLSDRMSHRPGELSGGEQQRVAVARALVMHPRLLLADEPTGNLDGRTGRSIEDVLLDLNQRFGVTFMVVTHNPDLAERMPKRLRMDGGLVQKDESD